MSFTNTVGLGEYTNRDLTTELNSRIDKNKTLDFGDKVIHSAFSRSIGVVIDRRTDLKGYNYQIAFRSPDTNKTIIDWFKRDVLEYVGY